MARLIIALLLFALSPSVPSASSLHIPIASSSHYQPAMVKLRRLHLVWLISQKDELECLADLLTQVLVSCISCLRTCTCTECRFRSGEESGLF